MKKALLTTLQIGVTIGLLWWVFHDPGKRTQMVEALRKANWSWLWIGVAVFLVSSLLATVRWKILLHVQGIEMRWVKTWQLFMIGMFFNLFMLGSTGGDVVKMFLTMREARNNKAAALLSVFMDRAIGMMALILISLGFLYLRYDVLSHSPASSALIYTLIWLLVAAVSVTLGMFVVSAFGWVHYLPKWTPLRGQIVEVSIACHMYAKAWRQTIWAFLISFPLLAMFFITFYCAAKAFTDQLCLVDVFAVLPIVAVITAIPISVSGIGLRESLFVSLLAPFGVGAAVATLISVTGFLINMVGSLIGGLVFLLYRSSNHEKINLREIRTTVDQLEDQFIDREPK